MSRTNWLVVTATGFYTSPGYWVIGPVLIYRLWTTTRAPDDQPRRLPRSSRPRIDLNRQ